MDRVAVLASFGLNLGDGGHVFTAVGDGAKDGGASVYVLAREDLMRWYHVQGLSGLELTDKYRSVHGVYAHPTPLTKWLKAPAQALVCLDNNEDHYWGISFTFGDARVYGFIF